MFAWCGENTVRGTECNVISPYIQCLCNAESEFVIQGFCSKKKVIFLRSWEKRVTVGERIQEFKKKFWTGRMFCSWLISFIDRYSYIHSGISVIRLSERAAVEEFWGSYVIHCRWRLLELRKSHWKSAILICLILHLGTCKKSCKPFRQHWYISNMYGVRTCTAYIYI